MTAAISAALDYARRFGPVWGQTPARTGYRGSGGSRDASRDEDVLCRFWSEHPDAVPAVMTGEGSEIVALDIDIKNGRNGLDSLDLIGVSAHPSTPTAHTPSGGIHLLFRRPNHPVPTSLDRLGPGLEIKGDRGWITLPPGPGRRWDPHLGLLTPLAEMPPWMLIAEPVPQAAANLLPTSPRDISRYAEAALDDAVRTIAAAPAGKQRDTLNREIYGIARLVAGNIVPHALALESVQWAARQMVSHDARRPWRPVDLDRMVRAAFSDGLAHPRQPGSRAA